MKKVLLSSLSILCIFGMIRCSTHEDYCNHDFLEGAISVDTLSSYDNPYSAIKTAEELTLEEVNSIKLTKDEKHLDKSIFNINKEDVLSFYNESNSEISDENTISLTLGEYSFVFDKESDKLISMTTIDKEINNIRDIKIGDSLDKVINELPQFC